MRIRNLMRQILSWMLALIFLCSVKSGFAFSLFKVSQPMTEPSPPKLKMYTNVEKVEVPINKSTLSCLPTEYVSLAPLFDGNTDTPGGTQNGSFVTLDLGAPHMLAGIRFLPADTSKGSVNRCVGTKFYVSNDNKNFIPVASIEPDGNGDYTAEWKEIFFGSAGEYRYVRAELPPGGYFSEFEWLQYTDWKYAKSQGANDKDLFLGLSSYDVLNSLDAVVLVAVYNKDGILKKVVRASQQFASDTQTTFTMQVPELNHQIGDCYRVLVLVADGSPALEQPLEYSYNNSAQGFSMPNIFSDNMLLQADQPLTIWGKAPAKSKVSVTLENLNGGEAIKEVTADKNSYWETNLGSFSAGGNYCLTVRCGARKLIYNNITFGDVWLCVGQSNMDYYMLGGDDTANYLASKEGQKEAENPDIRILNLWNQGTAGTGAAVDNLPIAPGANAWAVMNKDTANYCSAIGYYFSQELQREYDIPIGLLSVAVGDTEINRWLPYGYSYGCFTSTDGGLFYNRVSPLEKLKIRGILMYQGEADQYRTALTTAEYRDALTGLIELYREIWGQDTPFYWAQLTRYKKDESEIRDAQRLTLDNISNPKNAGVISLIDLYGEYESGPGNCREDIHPHQKKEVAQRFLRYVKRDVYGDSSSAVSGPIYKRMKVLGNKIELTFECTGRLAVLPPERYADKFGLELIKQNRVDVSVPQEFEIAGEDGIFVKAHATIRGNTIILESNQVPNPQAARYAWGAYPEMPNLTDDTGLPAFTFTTVEPD